MTKKIQFISKKKSNKKQNDYRHIKVNMKNIIFYIHNVKILSEMAF